MLSVPNTLHWFHIVFRQDVPRPMKTEVNNTSVFHRVHLLSAGRPVRIMMDRQTNWQMTEKQSVSVRLFWRTHTYHRIRIIQTFHVWVLPVQGTEQMVSFPLAADDWQHTERLYCLRGYCSSSPEYQVCKMINRKWGKAVIFIACWYKTKFPLLHSLLNSSKEPKIKLHPAQTS